MIYYKSTRGNSRPYKFSETILKGIAEDGGLFIPEEIPQFTLNQLRLLLKTSYQERASFIFNLFRTDFTKDAIKRIVNTAYSTNFDDHQIAPLVQLKDNQYLLELWHGPTLSFKDLALQIMPLFFSEAAEKKSVQYLILVATSGDTGTAALAGYKDKKKVSIIALYPKTHVSKLQELQMTTQEGNNLAVYAVPGDFDAVQKIVKAVFNDKDFNKELLVKYQTILSSANSINWGRLIPQIIYHISGYIDLVDRRIISLGDKIDIAVPTGNFGNILGAFYAKRMGLPVRKLICASNANNVLTQFLQTGIYDISNRKLMKTPSPAMDILVASNIERLLYEITKNPKKVSGWMTELRTKGKFKVDNDVKTTLQKEFSADWISNEICSVNISKIYNQTEYLMDPHTSCAQEAAQRYIEHNSIISPVIICSTAHFAKFEREKSISVTNISIPKNLTELKDKKIRHTEKCSATQSALEKKIKKFLFDIILT